MNFLWLGNDVFNMDTVASIWFQKDFARVYFNRPSTTSDPAQTDVAGPGLKTLLEYVNKHAVNPRSEPTEYPTIPRQG